MQVDHWRTGHAVDCRQIQSMSTSVAAVNGVTGNCNSSQLVNAHGLVHMISLNTLFSLARVLMVTVLIHDFFFSGDRLPK
jgi:hypothetical protein